MTRSDMRRAGSHSLLTGLPGARTPLDAGRRLSTRATG